MTESAPTTSPTILNLKIATLEELRRRYMPYIKGGGMFVSTSHRYRIGDEVAIFLTLPDEKEKRVIASRVVWISPPGTSLSRPAGIGVKFNDADLGNQVVSRVDLLLAGAANSDQATFTL